MDNDQYEQITNDHVYQHLQRAGNDYAVLTPKNETGSEVYQQQHHVYDITHVPTGNEADNSIVHQQMARSEEGKQGSKICPPPAWLRWLMAIVGLGLLCLIVTLVVVFLWSKYTLIKVINRDIQFYHGL